MDRSCAPATIANGYAAPLATSGAKLESKDIVSPLWESLTTRPSLPNTPCELLTVEQTGATAAQRIAMARDELKKAGATALAVTGLDCVGWLTNMRARDLPCTPLAVASALVTMDSCTLFIAPGRLNDADTKTKALFVPDRRWQVLLASFCLYHQPLPFMVIRAWFAGCIEQAFPRSFYHVEGGERTGAVCYLHRIFPDGASGGPFHETLRV